MTVEYFLGWRSDGQLLVVNFLSWSRAVNVAMWLALCFTIICLLKDAGCVALLDILTLLESELAHQTILLVQGRQDNELCWNGTDFNGHLPILNFNEDQTMYLKHSFNSKMLVLVCLNTNSGDIMNALYSDLEDMRENPTILFAFSDQQIRDLLRESFAQKMLNVMAFKGSDRSIIYSFQAFPKFKILQRNVSQINIFFEPQLKDLGGYILKGLPDNNIPRTVVYRDSHGQRHLAGYISTLIRNYIELINGTLEIAWHLVPEHGLSHLTDFTRTTDIDFAIGIDGMVIDSPNQSIAVQLSSWFVIVPMEASLSRTRFFLNMGFQGMIPIAIVLGLVLCTAHRLEDPRNWRDIWVINRVLRGILSQPFILPRYLSPRLMFIYCLTLISGFFMSNYYTANLATLLMNPPEGNRIRSWEQMRSSKVKILIVEEEFNFLRRIVSNHFVDNHSDLFKITDSADYQKKRTALDTSYAYPATLTLWPVLEQQQKRLQRHIFRKSNELVFTPLIIMNMPMPQNSIFMKSFQRYMGIVRQSGLVHLWFKRSFNDLTALGIMSYKKDESTKLFHDIEWQDFYFIWLGYLSGICISLFAFSFEHIVYRLTPKKVAG